jgi:Flp pilus assembly protein TadG
MLWPWRICRSLAALRRDRRGAAAIEFAMCAGFLSVAVLNAADVSIYLYQRMEVENATEMGAQAAWKTCDVNSLPATVNCSGLTDAVTKAVQGTTLGTRITLQSGSPSEGYYCVNSSNALQLMNDVSTAAPADCSAAGTPGNQPGDYVKIQTTFTYAPLFPGITVAAAFAGQITRTAMMRLA